MKKELNISDCPNWMSEEELKSQGPCHGWAEKCDSENSPPNVQVDSARDALESHALLGRLSRRLPPILMKYEEGFHWAAVENKGSNPSLYEEDIKIMSLKILCELLQGEMPEEHLKGLDETATNLQLALSNATD